MPKTFLNHLCTVLSSRLCVVGVAATLLAPLSGCTLINPPVLDRSQAIEGQVDEYYRQAKLETTLLSALAGGAIGALACRNKSGGVIAGCAAGGAAVGAGVGYAAFSAFSGEREALKNASEADRIAYLEKELQAEREYLARFKRRTLRNLASLRDEIREKKKEIAAGERRSEDLARMRKEVAASREKVKELLAARKEGTKNVAELCESSDAACTQTLLARRKALRRDITQLERQIDNEYALVEQQLEL